MDKDAQAVIDSMDGDNSRRRSGLLRVLGTKVGGHKEFKWYWLPLFTLVSLGVGIYLRPAFDYWREGLVEWVDQCKTGQVIAELEGKKLFAYRDDFEDFSNHPHTFYKPIPQEFRRLIGFLSSEESEILPDIRKIVNLPLLLSIKPQFWPDVVYEGNKASRLDCYINNVSKMEYRKYDSCYQINFIDYGSHGPDGDLDFMEIVQFSRGGRVVNIMPRSPFNEAFFMNVLDPAYQFVMRDLPSVPSEKHSVVIDRDAFDW